jgi:hypothetical protein
VAKKKKPEPPIEEQIDGLLWLMTNSVTNQMEMITKIWAGLKRPDWSLNILAELEWMKSRKNELTFMDAARELRKIAQKHWNKEGHKILDRSVKK